MTLSLLTATLAVIFVRMPQLVATTSNSFAIHSRGLARAFGEANVPEAVSAVVQVVSLLPLIGTALTPASAPDDGKRWHGDHGVDQHCHDGYALRSEKGRGCSRSCLERYERHVVPSNGDAPADDLAPMTTNLWTPAHDDEEPVFHAAADQVLP